MPKQVVADELTYNGLSFGEFVVERSAAYINQNDIHFGELTVTETLRFAALCQSSRTRVRERQQTCPATCQTACLTLLLRPGLRRAQLAPSYPASALSVHVWLPLCVQPPRSCWRRRSRS